MTAHIHAKQMADYSEDALKTDRPWELWEFISKNDALIIWHILYDHPSWSVNEKYRRKQNINLEDAPKITAFKLLKQIDEKAANWIKENGLKKDLNGTKNLSCLFVFNKTDEGNRYWYDLHEKLEKEIKEHGI